MPPSFSKGLQAKLASKQESLSEQANDAQRRRRDPHTQASKQASEASKEARKQEEIGPAFKGGGALQPIFYRRSFQITDLVHIWERSKLSL